MTTRMQVALVALFLLLPGLISPEAGARRRRAAAATGKIVGQLRISHAQPPANPSRAYWSFGAEDLPTRRLGASPGELVVFLDLWDESALSGRSEPELVVEGAEATPPVLVIPRLGDTTTVTFRNLDGIRYQFAASPEHADLRNFILPAKGRENVKMGGIPHRDVGGHVHYQLSTQDKPDVRAELLFLRSSAFVRPGADGQFTLESLPAGQRILRICHRGEIVLEQKVNIGKGTLDLGMLKVTLKRTR